ncbi:ABC transporter permease [Roseomonas sp. AR75]|uniref:ABC transporter permease n=1 Tax=Roseomonas sp. AR75 TaxID=2562311 RepID=UPI0010BF756F|nr:ABC transporter permease [Roseomonas sp. AR75]
MTAARIGWALLAAIAAFGILGPLLAGDPLRQDLSATLQGPGAVHPLGTDQFGRDMLARLTHATRLSLGFAAVAAVAAAVPGIALGLIAAWRGGIVERALVSLADAVMALPGLLLVVLFAAFAPGEFLPLYLGLSLALWVEYFRLTRGVAASLLARPAVEAARLFGFGPWHVLRHHLLPELAPMLVTLLAFSAAAAVTAISALAFVGIGLRPPTPEWGSMMTELLPYHAEAPLQVLLPGLLLALTVLGLQLVAGARR